MIISSKMALQNDILDGVNILADAVSTTLGPRGRNVILKEKSKIPIITKDGVSVANHLSVDHPIQNLGIEIIKQASQQTASQAGDGTTTSIV
ncbi:molecular chaperone GroEL, partial [bacterium]|nr:molecular chaperone GroEL [bacterium]